MNDFVGRMRNITKGGAKDEPLVRVEKATFTGTLPEIARQVPKGIAEEVIGQKLIRAIGELYGSKAEREKFLERLKAAENKPDGTEDITEGMEPDVAAAVRDLLVPVLVRILAEKMVELDGRIRNLPIWPQVDALPETVLDILAGDMHIDWYDYDADISVKRTSIKAGVAVHKRLGTLWAVQKVITDYFGAGEVREWFTYGGEPHHFKVVSGNAEMVGINLDRFVNMLEHVKRKSSWLDSVEVGLTAENMLYTGIAYAEHDVERISIEDEFSMGGEALFGPTPSEIDKNISALEQEIVNRAEEEGGK